MYMWEITKIFRVLDSLRHNYSWSLSLKLWFYKIFHTFSYERQTETLSEDDITLVISIENNLLAACYSTKSKIRRQNTKN